MVQEYNKMKQQIYLDLPVENGEAMTKASSAVTVEVVKPGTTTLMAMPQKSEGADAAITFQDWLEISASVMADISESSSTWWREVIGAVETTYDRWLAASPIERLGIEPVNTEVLTSGKWMRVNARAASMLLSSMVEELKGDMVARRCTQNCVRMMFRVFTYYQPGGSAERTDVLRRLQNPGDYCGGDSLEAVLRAVRAWPRLMERCRAVQMEPPDPSVLARGLLNLTDKYINESTDASFRTSMIRTSLRLDARPSIEQVMSYQKHLQAELEAMATGKLATSTITPKLKAVDTTVSPKARDANKGTVNGDLCRYFSKASGCRRGDKCSYSHSMLNMDKETRSKKCLKCGAENHRAKDCPVGKPRIKDGAGNAAPPKEPKAPMGATSSATNVPKTSMATISPSSTVSTAATDTVQGTPWTLEALIQAAQQVVQPQPPQAEASGETSPEKTRPHVRTIRLRDIRVCAAKLSTTALVDSGATHSLRTAHTEQEWQEAADVVVQLAGNYKLMMKITEAGTLLMPYRQLHASLEDRAVAAQTIVPMGQLIQSLGYSMVWNPNECYLQSPEGDRIQMQLDGGCPQLREMEALALIARLEDRRLEELSNATLTTRDKLQVSAMAMERSWDFYLMDYVMTGSFESGLRAVRDAPFFADLPGECLTELIPTESLWCGWDIMKELGCFTRPQRRRIHQAKRWIVHLFAGKEGHWEIMKLDQGDTVVLEFDIERSPGLDVLRSEVWRMLLWGAKEGKIDVVMGAPPSRSQQSGRGGERDAKSMKLVARMMWLHAVAQLGREVNGTPMSKSREVGFILEYPEGLSPAARRARERLIEEREDEVRVPRGRAGAASWNESRWFWEYVQRPRLELYTGAPTMDASNCFWDTRMWKCYEREKSLRTVSFDQGAMGSVSRNRTTLGTNVNNLLALDELRLPDESDLPENDPKDYIWSQGLVEAMVVALSFWHKEPHRAPMISMMTPSQWKEHVDSNHEVYKKECATCVTSRGTGAQHRRVHHPDTYVLTADVAGPITKGLDPTSKGTMGKNLRYLLVAKYMVPKQYLQLYTGRKPPDDDGLEGSPEEAGAEDTGAGAGLEDLFEDILVVGPEDHDVVEVYQIPEAPSGELDAELEEEIEDEPVLQDEGDDILSPEGEEQPTSRVDTVMQGGDCTPPEMTYLTFAVGLPNNQSATIKYALQDVVLYLNYHGLPVYRFHADKGEFFNNQFRSWLRERGILGTWSEPGIPQTNAHAENTVRWIKDRARTLLRGASFPVKLWPVAAAAAAAQQRAKVLGWKSLLAAPFGSTVHIRKKAFDKTGPLRREQAMDSKWIRGRYAGLSTILHRGHLIYVPAEGEESEKFFHTLHVRPNLVEPSGPDTEYCVDIPRPRRRLTGKYPPEAVEMRQVDTEAMDITKLATEEAQCILENWDEDRARNLVIQLARSSFFDNRKFGVFRHGGAVGWMKGIDEFPHLVQILSRLVVECNPEATFTSMLVSVNSLKPLHKDNNNDPRTHNYVIPIMVPSRGGEVWVELRQGDCVHGVIEQRLQGDRMVYGQKLQLTSGEGLKFNPRSAHEVCDWEGERIVLIAYSPQCLGKLNQADVTKLHDFGFPVPLSQLPEFYENEEGERIYGQVQYITVDDDKLEADTASEWELYLEVGSGMTKLTDASQTFGWVPQLYKTEVVYTSNIEKILSELVAPLDVTYTVNPSEVFSQMELWKPAIEKEMKSIEVAIDRLPPGSDKRRHWLNLPGVQKLPTKFAFTIKPNDKADPSDPSTWYKRKARLVVCGNMAAEDGASVYTEAAPAEAVRAGLTLTVEQGWAVAVLDVVAAFLRTPMGRTKKDPLVIVQPPRLLEALGLIEKLELWGLIRALYGLRQSPALWGDYRDYVLRSTDPPSGLRLRQGSAATSWWKVVDEVGVMTAIILVYVDDFLICGPDNIVSQLSKWIRSIWETSEPTYLRPGTSIRFLGMELHVEEANPGEIGIGQHGYIQELLRLHDIPAQALDKKPVSKEMVAEQVGPVDVCKDDVHKAQQLTGEVLWLAQRSRPDLSYATSVMASLCLRNPTQVINIGMKVLGYLQRTSRFQLKIRAKDNSLVMYSDAAFAPQGGRSHGGWLVTYAGAPIMWRSGRQQMITLSTAEAELLAVIDGAIATKGIESLLGDMGIFVEEKKIASDSMAALAITGGSSSWRTRHLKIKAGWLSEQIEHGLFTTVHCPGERQPADLLTKALSSVRLLYLLQIWGVGDQAPRVAVSRSTTELSSRLLVAMVCCLLMVSVQAREHEPSRSYPGAGLQVDYDVAGVLMILLMLLGVMVIWEALRWAAIEFCNEWTPGANARRLKRLQKLQAATTAAIEKELNRLQEEPHAQTRQNKSLEGYNSETEPQNTKSQDESDDTDGITSMVIWK
ncbi:Retrovirus-related Pol polyprotein from transposon TNT 1-94 [Symbiodinium microadriaticum]|uniref:Retrovirus-related Pol polyprotein from transposon TNT 1-94 n=1 Tax=Symbiodinium microadriaticum TaxID=2951 RepID=A0A1Q9CXV9_SYMMI|nr:Retrovirus-related Pol polyprotein from transposon TNT 1-94 [Symbiodinium microadriaticum]